MRAQLLGIVKYFEALAVNRINTVSVFDTAFQCRTEHDIRLLHGIAAEPRNIQEFGFE